VTGESVIWAIIPAAGAGSRMQTAIPKQYLPLRNRPVLAHTLERICGYSRVRGVLVGIAAHDSHWHSMQMGAAKLRAFLGTFQGGAQRAHTVLNGLDALSNRAQEDDWVMVHDAVRPCVRHADIDALIAATGGSDGALLALPVSDTVKRADADGRVEQTISRNGLWRALTPQIFRYDALRQALHATIARGDDVTDEASAMERAGLRPRVIAGHADNVKITVAGDVALAEFILARQEQER